MNTKNNYLDKVIKSCYDLENGLITYEDWANEVIGESIYGTENLRRCYNFFKKFVTQLTEKMQTASTNFDAESTLKTLKNELIKERKKIQTANLEYNKNMREQARFEMFNERIEEAIKELPPLEFSPVRFEKKDIPERTAVLCIGDAHNGTSIDMQSLFGEKVNYYSPEILQGRLNKLCSQVIDDFDFTLDYNKLIVFDLGDQIQNYLRLSNIAKLQTGVIESTIDYAEKVCNWLTMLSNGLQVPIEYICLGGNHCELRLLEKGRNWEEENLGRVIREFVAMRLKDNPNITVDPYSEFGFKTVQGVNILAIHGDNAKNDFEEISFWENYHNITIDILLMGHLHHKEENNVSYDKEVIHIPSLVGIDTFSKKCRKIARAGAKFMIFENGEKTWEKVIWLN